MTVYFNIPGKPYKTSFFMFWHEMAKFIKVSVSNIYNEPSVNVFVFSLF